MIIQLFLAQGGSDILTRDLNQVQQTAKVWDEIWTNTFSSFTSGSSYYLLNYIATFIAAGASLFWLARWARDLALSSNWWSVLPRFIWILIILLFLSNHGQRLANLTLGFRGLINSWQQSVLQVQISEVTLQSVLNNQLATSGLKDAVSQAIQQCNQMSAPSVAIPSISPPSDYSNLTPAQQQVYAKLACYQKAASSAKQLQQQYQTNYCSSIGGSCPGLSNFADQLLQAQKKAYDQVQSTANGNLLMVDFAPFVNAFGDVALTSFFDVVIKQILYSLQWIFANLMEMGLWLTALSGPIALATSILPMDAAGLPVWGWLITFFSFGLMQIYYVLILGISAELIARAQAETLNDLSFAFLLGLFAPLIAMSLATGGALVAIRGLASNVGQLVSAGVSLAGTATTTIVTFIAPFL